MLTFQLALSNEIVGQSIHFQGEHNEGMCREGVGPLKVLISPLRTRPSVDSHNEAVDCWLAGSV
ncbi:MAG: hypothetical protein WB420_14620 [Bradyrhizobium sp.]|jgi:hypothetical protein